MFGAAAALGLAALGSALGTGMASQAAIGGWKKCFLNDKPAPFLLGSESTNGLGLLGAGIFGGLAMGLSALMQGKTAARAADALAETGKGTANYFMVIGIVETVALFVMVFLLLMVG